jgi:hypothetical protein
MLLKIRGWLFFDIISLIPFDNSFPTETLVKFIRLIRLPKLVRLIDAKVIDKLFEDLLSNKKSSSFLIIFNLKYMYKIIRLVIIAVAITYCVACSWWFLINRFIKGPDKNNFIDFTFNGFFGGIVPETGYKK